MSNKIVPQVYRTIIDDVIKNVQVDFEEYGMDEEILQNLQAKWESKLLETRVADFARASDNKSDSEDDLHHLGQHPKPTSPSGPSSAMTQPAFGLSFPAGSHGLALPGQMMQGNYGSGSQQPMQGMGMRGYDGVNVKQDPDDLLRLRGGAPGDDVKPYIKPEPNAAGLLPGDEVIDSDLDDSDDELKDGAEDDEEGDIDIVFCVYDKVQRVKNKWKTVFKDGMIHVNGKDYLFAKCNGEFEW